MKTMIPYPGGKKRVAPWIISHIPPHRSYFEPYFGGGAVLFEKEPSKIETVNDLDDEVINFFWVIKDSDSMKELIDWLTYTPYARQIYEEAFQKVPKSPVDRAGYFAVKAFQSHGFRPNGNCGWKKDVHGREAAYAVRNWNRLPELLPAISARLKDVQIEHKPALELIKTFNHSNVFMYLDPPYVLSTRGRKMYKHEMSDQEHEVMLITVRDSKAKVMISGYDCDLYEKYLKDWRKEQLPARAQNNLPRTETIWMNF